MKAISANRQMVRAAMAAPYLERDEEHDLAVRWKDQKDQDCAAPDHHGAYATGDFHGDEVPQLRSANE